MPVQYFNGDIFDAPIHLLMHCCNCQHTMGAGLALEVKNRYPEAYEADLATTMGGRDKLGFFSVAKITKPTGQLRYILNCYCQFFYGRERRHLDYEATYRCFEAVRQRLIDNKRNHFVIGINYNFGSKNAGGDWEVVEAMIKSVFEESPLTILICKK